MLFLTLLGFLRLFKFGIFLLISASTELTLFVFSKVNRSLN
jgi:hypothetical protein